MYVCVCVCACMCVCVCVWFQTSQLTCSLEYLLSPPGRTLPQPLADVQWEVGVEGYVRWLGLKIDNCPRVAASIERHVEVVQLQKNTSLKAALQVSWCQLARNTTLFHSKTTVQQLVCVRYLLFD